MHHGEQAGASSPVPARAETAVLHGAQATVPVGATTTVQVKKMCTCSHFLRVMKFFLSLNLGLLFITQQYSVQYTVPCKSHYVAPFI